MKKTRKKKAETAETTAVMIAKLRTISDLFVAYGDSSPLRRNQLVGRLIETLSEYARLPTWQRRLIESNELYLQLPVDPALDLPPTGLEFYDDRGVRHQVFKTDE